MTIGERIKQIREEKEISQTKLAKAIHTTKQNIYKYENNIISNIPSDKIEAIAKYLSVSPAYLMGWEDEVSSQPYEQFNNIYPIKLKRFPLLRDIACGEPIYAEEGHESYVCADEDIKADFCLRASRDSMINAEIYDGDIVFIRKQPVVDNGEIAAVIIDDEATLKRVYFDKEHERLQLIAENPVHAPLVYTGQELENVRILGKAIALMRNL